MDELEKSLGRYVYKLHRHFINLCIFGDKTEGLRGIFRRYEPVFSPMHECDHVLDIDLVNRSDAGLYEADHDCELVGVSIKKGDLVLFK